MKCWHCSCLFLALFLLCSCCVLVVFLLCSSCVLAVFLLCSCSDMQLCKGIFCLRTLSHFLANSTVLFFDCWICLFVAWVALSCIDHALVIWSECCGNVAWAEWKSEHLKGRSREHVCVYKCKFRHICFDQVSVWMPLTISVPDVFWGQTARRAL